VEPRETSLTAKVLPIAERKARLGKMIEDGVISAERAALIDFREPTQKEREFARALAGKGRLAVACGERSPA
jgi:hypothetical protein